jgi:hypothetical protein
MVDLANPQVSINFAQIWYWSSIIGVMVFWCALTGFGIWFILKWRSYNVKSELFEIIGNSPVKTRVTGLKEILKSGGITKYEVRTNKGMFFKKYREYYYHNSPEYSIQSKKGKMEFKLTRLSFNTFNPISLNLYNNTLEKNNLEFMKEIAKFEERLSLEGKDAKKIREYYTYIPIPLNPPVEMEIIPQNLLPTLANEVVESNAFYAQHKWWEQYLFPFSLMIFIVVQFLLVAWIMQHSSGVAATCQAAKDGLVETIKQKIT